MCESAPDPRIRHLDQLRAELVAKGVKCELVAVSSIPRLQLSIPWEYYSADDEFQDNIIVSSEPDGICRFWWPWVQPIAPVDDITEAVDHIYENTMAAWDDIKSVPA